MEKISRLFLTLFFVLSLFFLTPPRPIQSSPQDQESNSIQATGPICALDTGECGTFSFTFPPLGGPVNGSYQLTFTRITSTGSYTYHENGTLIGNFSGGDAGTIDGTFTSVLSGSGYTTNYGGTWKGVLYANGNGSGTISAKGLTNTWTVTFSTAEFELSDSSSDGNSIPQLATENQAPLDTNDPAWVWNTSITERMHGWVEMDQAIAEMLGQDSALITRDTNGTFYVVDNQGNRKPIPSEIVDALQVNDNLALLSNHDLVENNPTVKALIAKEGPSVLNAIDGTGDLSLYTPPDWLKQRQYLWLMTQCEQGVCSGYTKISIMKSSGYINMKARGSSEHSSVRGTINGGGDFIFEPGPLAVGSLLFSILLPDTMTSYPPYLGVLVNDKSDGAEIVKIQTGSPAASADLQVGDLIANVDGVALDDQHSLKSVLSQFHGGDEIVLGIIRNGEIMTPDLTLAAWIPNVIETPSAWIMVSDQTELVYDIGLNGITAVYVISDKALVHEPETNTEVEVNAGMGLIIVPGEPVGEPFSVSNSDLNTWWNNPSESNNASSNTNPTTASNTSQISTQIKDFNPIPGVDGETLYWGGWFIIAILYFVVFIVKLVKKS